MRASPELCGAREGGRKAATLGELLTGVRAPGGNATHFALDFRPTPFPVPDNQTTTYGSIEFNLPASFPVLYGVILVFSRAGSPLCLPA